MEDTLALDRWEARVRAGGAHIGAVRLDEADGSSVSVCEEGVIVRVGTHKDYGMAIVSCRSEVTLPRDFPR
jgi:hypothetical protein